jgi:hypothetical protein
VVAAFENYDATGGFRTTEAGKAVASTPELRDCVARQWLRYVLRRQELPEEAGSVKALGAAFEDSSWDVRELLVAVTKARAFTHRKPGTDEGI